MSVKIHTSEQPLPHLAGRLRFFNNPTVGSNPYKLRAGSLAPGSRPPIHPGHRPGPPLSARGLLWTSNPHPVQVTLGRVCAFITFLEQKCRGPRGQNSIQRCCKCSIRVAGLPSGLTRKQCHRSCRGSCLCLLRQLRSSWTPPNSFQSIEYCSQALRVFINHHGLNQTHGNKDKCTMTGLGSS